MERGMQQPLYQWIREHIENGRLPETLCLPSNEKANDSLKFADGAMDGIHMYHTRNGTIELEPLIQVLEQICNAQDEMAVRQLLEYSKEVTALSAIDELQNYMIEHRESLDASKIFQFAYHLVQNTSERELVKYGLALLELFQHREETFDDILRTLALSNEFTLFVLFNMRSWENAEEEILEVAKKVEGWGRIFAVEELSAEQPQTRYWLLTEGIHNNIIPDYSALSCYEKSGMLNWLKQEMTDAEFRGAGEILQVLLSEGPVAGISAIPEKPELFQSYLNQAKQHKLEATDYEILLDLMDYEEKQENKVAGIAEQIHTMLSSIECTSCINQAVLRGENFSMAKRLGLPYEKAVYQSIEQDFEKNYFNSALLMSDGNYVEECISLFEQRLPLDTMATGPAQLNGFGKEYINYHILIAIVQLLKRYPGKGDRLLKTALRAPVINNRNIALTVLEEWVEKQNDSLEKLYPEYYSILKELILIEPEASIRTRMEKLIQSQSDSIKEKNNK